jgi:hypothetical protein
MDNAQADVRGDARGTEAGEPLRRARVRVTTRGVQIALGVIWLSVGLFQFKSFMYTHGLITEVFGEAMEKQWSWVGHSMKAIDDFYGRDLTLWNTLAAEIQCAIGLGLILSRKTVKPALVVSFVWAPLVWWFGEGFGGLTANTLPAPLMGAPGAVIVYAIVGLLVWPRGDRTRAAPAAGATAAADSGPGMDARSPGAAGPLGDSGGLAIWSGLWLLSAFLWLVNVNRAKGATSEMIKSMAEASPHWLARIQSWAVHHAQGHGTTIAVVLACVSAAVAVCVWLPALRWPALWIGIALSLAYWLFGQSLGGPFWAEGATDFNAGPLFVLLAVALFPVAQRTREPAAPAAVGAARAEGVAVG